jgi:ATP-dependent helicase/nuclease subunit B
MLLREAASADARREAARAFLRQASADTPTWVISGTVEAAATLTRESCPASFGWQRATLMVMAQRLAREGLARAGRSVATPLALEAVWVRVAFTLAQSGALGRFSNLAGRPGLARAFSQSVDALRLAGLGPQSVDSDLARAWVAFDEQCRQLSLADRAEVLSVATTSQSRLGRLVFLDVPLRHQAEEAFAQHLLSLADDVLVICPSADGPSLERWSRLVGPSQSLPEGAGPLTSLQQGLFRPHASTAASTEIEMLSAPGDGREAVEVVRRLKAHAEAGVPLDAMAVGLRNTVAYRAHFAEAFRRANLAAWFDQGSRAPDPAGRAFLALLACAAEGLSATRFAEYLSLAQVPKANAHGGPPAPSPRFVSPESTETLTADEEVTPVERQPPEDPTAPVVAGGLRAPRRWEKLLVEAAVIGGLPRWRRRLAGLLATVAAQLADDPTLSDAQIERLQRQHGDIEALTTFALPVLETLSAFPASATWGEWLVSLHALATQTLKQPGRVLAILAELNAMAVVGPVSLAEVRTVLQPRLVEVVVRPEEGRRPAGSVWVGPIERLRGRSFQVVAVPGLAERVFPPKLKEDPLVPDRIRVQLSAQLQTNAQRVADERLQLALACGAAQAHLILSYPRVDVENNRPRVPSFYLLEAARAAEGALPSFEHLSQRAEAKGDARLGWPAPRQESAALDDAEYDLAVLERVFRQSPRPVGAARYLVEANPTVARALRHRYQRWSVSRWTSADGLVRPGELGQAALAAHQLSARAFSPTALELFAACPYKFYLSALLRLHVRKVPEALEQLGPLEKGSMAHEVQYLLLSQLRQSDTKVSAGNLPQVFERLDRVIAEVAAHTKDEFAPAIEHVWLDGVESMRADLREWVRRVAADPEWGPDAFELSFGLSNRSLADPASVAEPVTLPAGVRLRGSIDLVERSVRGTLRATDYKTGKARAKHENVIGGGRHLQPVLYASTLEQLRSEPVESGRLYYCTQAGGYEERVTPLDAATRQSLHTVVAAIGQALSQGSFPAHPDKAKGGRGHECHYCDYAPVCGPDEARRAAKKDKREVAALLEVRKLP